MIIRDVTTVNYSGPSDIINDLNRVDGNRFLQGHVTRANVIFTNRSGKSLVKLLVDFKSARDEVISRGRIQFRKPELPICYFGINPEHEIRYCYN